MSVIYRTGANKFVAAGQSVVVAKPAGTVFPDMLMFFGSKRTGIGGSWSLPTGWTQFEATSIAGLLKTVIAFRFVDDSDLPTTDYTFTFTGGGNQQMNGILARIELACGLEGGATSSAGNQPIVTMVCPSYDVIKNLSLVLRVLFYIFATTEPSSVTAPAGVTLQQTSDGAGSNDSQIKLYTEDSLFPPGATGAKTFTAVGSSGNITGRFYTLGIEPSPSGIGGLTGLPRDKSGQLLTKADVLAARAHAIKTGAKVKTKFDPRRR